MIFHFSKRGFPNPGSTLLKDDFLPCWKVQLKHCPGTITTTIHCARRPVCQKEGVGPETEHEDNDNQLLGGDIWLGNTTSPWRWKNGGRGGGGGVGLPNGGELLRLSSDQGSHPMCALGPL